MVFDASCQSFHHLGRSASPQASSYRPIPAEFSPAWMSRMHRINSLPHLDLVFDTILHPLAQINPASLSFSQNLEQIVTCLLLYQTSNHLVLPYPVLFCFALLCPNVKASYQGCHDLPLSYRAGPRHEKPSRALVSFARTSLRGWAARCCAIYFGPVCVN